MGEKGKKESFSLLCRLTGDIFIDTETVERERRGRGGGERQKGNVTFFFHGKYDHTASTHSHTRDFTQTYSERRIQSRVTNIGLPRDRSSTRQQNHSECFRYFCGDGSRAQLSRQTASVHSDFCPISTAIAAFLGLVQAKVEQVNVYRLSFVQINELQGLLFVTHECSCLPIVSSVRADNPDVSCATPLYCVCVTCAHGDVQYASVNVTITRCKGTTDVQFSCSFSDKKERKHGALRLQKPLKLIRDGEAGGSGIFISNTYSLHCYHHQNDCFKVGSCVSHFKV